MIFFFLYEDCSHHLVQAGLELQDSGKLCDSVSQELGLWVYLVSNSLSEVMETQVGSLEFVGDFYYKGR